MHFRQLIGCPALLLLVIQIGWSCKLREIAPPGVSSQIKQSSLLEAEKQNGAPLPSQQYSKCPIADGRVFYSCFEETHRCTEKGMPYITETALKALDAYDNGAFSPAGRTWYRDVTKCMAQVINEKCTNPTDCPQPCASVKKLSIERHPECYMRHGFCTNLTQLDYLAWLTVLKKVSSLKLVADLLNDYFLTSSMNAFKRCFLDFAKTLSLQNKKSYRLCGILACEGDDTI